MDSTSVRPVSASSPAHATEAEEGLLDPAVPEDSSGALSRLGRLLPGIDALVQFAYRLAAVSLVSVGVIVAALADAVAPLTPGALALIGAILALPAAATALAGWTLADLASLPGQVKQAALAATGRADASAGRIKGSRIGRLVRSLWAARGLALLTKGGWMKAVGALRFVRLASLPFALALLGAVALNGVVIAGGLVAVMVLLF